MRVVVAAFALAFFAGSASLAESERWIFIGSTDQVTFREDLEVETDKDSLFLGGVYQADFRVRRQLSGSPLPRRQPVVFIGGHMPKDVGVKRWFVVARPSEYGAFAGQNWRWIEKGRLCLRPEEIVELGLGSSFTNSKAGGGGRRCIKM